jgi:hypothetical protein
MTASRSAPLHRTDCVAMLFVNDETSSVEYRDNEAREKYSKETLFYSRYV